MTNFVYDGQYLSDYGFVVCKFDTDTTLTFDSIGAKVKFEKVSKNNGKRFGLASSGYEECIAAEFDICKNPDIYDGVDMEITTEELKSLARWLNRREFLAFQPIDDCDGETEQKFYSASFNISKIESGDILYGLRLKMETDSPFGYGRERRVILNFSEDHSVKTIRDLSDEIGFLYPYITIVCKEDGAVTLYNEMENCRTVIKNCIAGEIIIMDGENQIIQTSRSDHDIMNDFNYEFFKIGNTVDDRVNKIEASIPCSVEIKYRPIIKDIP